MPYYPYYPKDNESTEALQASELLNEEITDENNAEYDMPAEQTSDYISADEYQSRKHIFFGKLIIDLIFGSLFFMLPCFMAWATLAVIREGGYSALIGIIFFLAEIAGALVVIYETASSIGEHAQDFMTISKAYLNNTPAEELTLRKKKSKKRAIVFVSVSGVLLLILIAAISIKPLTTAITYNKAEKLIKAEQYTQAFDILVPIRDSGYKDSAALLRLCSAHERYDRGDIIAAYKTLHDVQFNYQSKAHQAKIESFREILKKDYDKEYEPIAAAHRAQVEEWNREYLNKIKNGVPFVGMGDEYIHDTSLGRGSYDGQERYYNENRVWKMATRYKFYDNGKCVFIALCYNGSVVEVTDYRSFGSSSYVPKTSSGSRYDNSPSVEGFSNPEDFYDWYYDDFFDYEEAEDYYYSHGGW